MIICPSASLLHLTHISDYTPLLRSHLEFGEDVKLGVLNFMPSMPPFDSPDQLGCGTIGYGQYHSMSLPKGTCLEAALCSSTRAHQMLVLLLGANRSFSDREEHIHVLGLTEITVLNTVHIGIGGYVKGDAKETHRLHLLLGLFKVMVK